MHADPVEFLNAVQIVSANDETITQTTAPDDVLVRQCEGMINYVHTNPFEHWIPFRQQLKWWIKLSHKANFCLQTAQVTGKI